MIITIEQIKAARALLNWKQSDLSKEAGLSLASINNIERQLGSPRVDTLMTIKQTFQNAGIEFIGQEGVKKPSELFEVVEYQGENFIKDWMDDFTSCMQGPSDIMRVCGLDERNFPQHAPDQLLRYEAHQIETQFQEKIIIEEKDDFLLADPACYRWVSSVLLGTIPYLVYKDRFALAMYEAKRIIVVRNQSIANTFIKQFEFLWAQAKSLPSNLVNKLEDPAYRESLIKRRIK